MVFLILLDVLAEVADAVLNFTHLLELLLLLFGLLAQLSVHNLGTVEERREALLNSCLLRQGSTCSRHRCSVGAGSLERCCASKLHRLTVDRLSIRSVLACPRF